MTASIVQHLVATNGSFLNPNTLTPVTITTGNAMLVIAQLWSQTSQQTFTCSDGVNTWAEVFSLNSAGGNAQMLCFQTTNASPSLSAGTISITGNAPHSFVGVIHFFEISGSVPNGGCVSQSGDIAGTTASVQSTVMNVSVANSLCLAAVGVDQNTTGTVTKSAATFTQGVPTTGYPSTTTFDASGGSVSGRNIEDLETNALVITATGNQQFTETLSTSLFGWFTGMLQIKNPPVASGNFFLVL